MVKHLFFNMEKSNLFFVLLLGFGLLSCNTTGVSFIDDEQGETVLHTKAPESNNSGTKDINFHVTETDVLNYIYRNTASPTILSLDPVKRDNDTLMYVVNYSNGWSLFSADKHLEPVVA